MARPREFDLDKAIDKAMILFWDTGYEVASLSELLAAMDISKGSFYKAFKDKHSVYMTALRRYDGTVIAETVGYLRDETNGSGRNRIVSLFRKVEASAASDNNRLGCFLCNALVDKAPEGGEIDACLQAMVRRLETAFFVALGGSCDQSSPASNDLRKETARGILSLYFGLQVLGRAGMAGAMAADCVRQAERLIDSVAKSGRNTTTAS